MPTWRPTCVEPVNETFVGHEAGRELGSTVDEQLKNRRQRMAREHAIADALHGERAQRGFGRRFPYGRITRDRRKARVP
jgi:hypothetical protein